MHTGLGTLWVLLAGQGWLVEGGQPDRAFQHKSEGLPPTSQWDLGHITPRLGMGARERTDDKSLRHVLRVAIKFKEWEFGGEAERGTRARPVGTRSPGLLCSSCATLGKSLNLSEPQSDSGFWSA